LQHRFAYWNVGVAARERDRSVEAFVSDIASPLTRAEFGFKVQRLLAAFPDCHAQVNSFLLAKGFLPFLIEDAEGGPIAIKPDRSDLVDHSNPYVIAIDGRPLEDWLEVAQSVVPKGSPQFVRLQSLKNLRLLQHWRTYMGVEAGPSVEVRLGSDSRGRRTVRRAFQVSRDFPEYGTWPPTTSQLLPANIGYLRLSAMNDVASEEIASCMPRFLGTRALIIDVRGNKGGRRRPTLELLSYLVTSPLVGTAAVHCLDAAFPEDHLTERSMYRADWDGWSPSQREAIERFREGFEPDPRPPSGFSEWHYFVAPQAVRSETYDRQVFVLADAHCFSATDVFLATLKQRHDVVILGQPSSGGSGYAKTYQLTESGMKLRLSSMLSYQPPGHLFDGHGVTPGKFLQPTPEFFTSGDRDRLLEEAISLAKVVGG